MIPKLGSKLTFTQGSRKGCKATVTKRVPRHGYFVVAVEYVPQGCDYRKGETLHTTPSTRYVVG